MTTRTIINPVTPIDFIAAGLIRAKQRQLDIAKQELARAQNSGRFPVNRSEYFTLLRQRGSSTRRRLSTIRPEFMAIPNSIIFVNQTQQANVLPEAMRFIENQFRRKAPVRTGEYRESLSWFLNGVLQPAGPDAILRLVLAGIVNERTRIEVVSVLPYSSTLESLYFIKKQFLIYGIWRELTKIFKDRISAQFNYRSAQQFGATYKGKPYAYAIPILTLGVAGAFNSRATSPGERYRLGRNKRGPKRNRITRGTGKVRRRA